MGKTPYIYNKYHYEINRDAVNPMEEAEKTGEEETEKEAAPEEDAPEETASDERAPKEIAEEDGDGEEEEDGEDAPGDGEASSPLPLPSIVEAVLFAARDPLKLPQLARAVGKGTRQEAVKDAIAGLNVQYLETGRAFEIAEISGRYQLMSRPEFAPHIMRIYPKRELAGDREKAQRLTPAALDTLAIIAYKQPVTRAEIEHIRGVGCGPVLKALLERDSIRVAGKRLDMLGQPLVYGTTESFLAEFGLGSLDELPMRADFFAVLGLEPPAEGVIMELPGEPPPQPEPEPPPNPVEENPGEETEAEHDCH